MIPRSGRSKVTGKFSKIYCNCNDDWSEVMIREATESHLIVHCGLNVGKCPNCGMNPWMYYRKVDEPLPKEE